MFDIGWPELLVICVVALVVVGPEDLPKIMHTLGVWTGKARRMFLTIEHDLERLGAEAEQLERAKKAAPDALAPPEPSPSAAEREEEEEEGDEDDERQ